MNADPLAAAMLAAATLAAHRRLVAIGWTPADIETDRARSALAAGPADTLAGRVSEAVREAWPAAMADAREAMALGMEAIAMETFKASIVLAGIAAADAHHAATRPESAAVA